MALIRGKGWVAFTTDPDKQSAWIKRHYDGRILMADEMRAVYRQCDDTECKAYRLDLPHSHFEFNESAAEAAHANERINLLSEFNATMTIHPANRAGGLVDVTGLDKVEPQYVESPVTEWLSIPVGQTEWLMQKVGEYVTWIETGMTKDVCKCVWILHPEKGNIRGGETALDCPAHSKEGLVLGFFAWLTAKPEPLKQPCTLGNVATVDALWVCCNSMYPRHAAECPERLCAEHGD